MSCAYVLQSGRPGLQAGWRSWHTDLAPSGRAAAEARRFVRGHAADLSEDERHALELLTSELVTNAVTHGRSDVRVGVTLGSNGVLVAVHDHDRLLPEQRPYTAEHTSGRGLALLQQLADEWGVEPDEEGKSVWFSLLFPSAYDRWSARHD